jgi:hypothetical protein
MSRKVRKPAVLLLGVAALAIVAAGALSASAQSCERMPLGPDRTDCFIAQAQIAGAKANAAAAAARVQTDAAILRATTGTSRTAKARRVRRGSQAR